MLYVVTKPDSIRGVYATWAECKSKVAGVAGAVYQKVENEEQAQLLLAGGGIMLPPGLHVFTDGNHRGGVGVVVVWADNSERNGNTVVAEISATVGQVFYGGRIPGLGSDAAIRGALDRSGNALAELAGLYLALWQAPEQARLTIVHDFEGVGAWSQGRWRAKEVTVKAVVTACRALADEKGLRLEFVWQRGHTSTWAGRNDFAKFNNRADELATKGSSHD